MSDSKVILQCLIGTIRELCRHEHCISFFATPETVSIFHRALEICVGNENVVSDIIATLYALVQHGSDQRVKLSASPVIVDVLMTISLQKKLLDLVASVLTGFCLDAKSRHTFTDEKIPELLTRIFKMSESSDTIYNTVSSIYSLSKIPKCRDQFLAAKVDTIIMAIPVQDNPSLKNNVARTLKNLASEAAESLEEGTISSLIAMSLEGKKKQLKEDVIPVDISAQDFKSTGPPVCIVTDGNFTMYHTWKVTHQLTLGGSAGKGPPAPETPAMDSESSDAFNSTDGTQDVIEITETEGKTKMAFAKMKVSDELKESFKLTDEDFRLEEEKLQQAAEAKEDAAINGTDLDTSLDYEEVPMEFIPIELDMYPPGASHQTADNTSSGGVTQKIGKSPKATPKVTPKSSPKNSPKQLSRKSSKNLLPNLSSRASSAKEKEASPNAVDAAKVGLYN
jgi:hypothetical protein